MIGRAFMVLAALFALGAPTHAQDSGEVDWTSQVDWLKKCIDEKKPPCFISHELEWGDQSPYETNQQLFAYVYPADEQNLSNLAAIASDGALWKPDDNYYLALGNGFDRGSKGYGLSGGKLYGFDPEGSKLTVDTLVSATGKMHIDNSIVVVLTEDQLAKIREEWRKNKCRLAICLDLDKWRTTGRRQEF